MVVMTCEPCGVLLIGDPAVLAFVNVNSSRLISFIASLVPGSGSLQEARLVHGPLDHWSMDQSGFLETAQVDWFDTLSRKFVSV